MKGKFKLLLEQSGKLPLFELTKEDTSEPVLFYITATDKGLKATHEPLTVEELEGRKASFVLVAYNEDFSLDEHLEALIHECQIKLMEVSL